MARPPSVYDLLYDPEAGCGFEPFQAVRLLEQLTGAQFGEYPPSGDRKAPDRPVRFRGHLSLNFWPSRVAQIVPPFGGPPDPPGLTKTARDTRNRYRPALPTGSLEPPDRPVVVCSFFGLIGPNGALPVCYTERLFEVEYPSRQGTGSTALRDWLDLFSDRMTALLYRGWLKYRMPAEYLRAVRRPGEPGEDPVTRVLFSLVGLGVPAVRNRLAVRPANSDTPLAAVDDRAVLRFAAAFARRRPGGHELAAILTGYFGVPAEVRPLTGQWLPLPKAAQTQLQPGRDVRLGVNTVAGDRVWDPGSRFRIRLGPVQYDDTHRPAAGRGKPLFIDLLPDPEPVPDRKAVYLLAQLTRLYVGAEFDFDVQLLLAREEVPPCKLVDDPEKFGARLGWNTWAFDPAFMEVLPDVVDDVVFDAPCDPVLPG